MYLSYNNFCYNYSFLILFILLRNVIGFNLSFIQSRLIQTKLQFALQFLVWISHSGMKFCLNVPSGLRNMSRGSACSSVEATWRWMVAMPSIRSGSTWAGLALRSIPVPPCVPPEGIRSTANVHKRLYTHVIESDSTLNWIIKCYLLFIPIYSFYAYVVTLSHPSVVTDLHTQLNATGLLIHDKSFIFEVPPVACPDPAMLTDNRKLRVCLRFSATKKLARTILFIRPDFSSAYAATLW
jgi:hypothetical protein